MKSLLPIALVSLLIPGCSSTYSQNEPAAAIMKTDVYSPINSFITSAYSFDETNNRLKSALSANGLKTFAVIDHGEGARSVGEDIGESKLYIFGNPKSGTPLLKSDPRMGFELPLKILVRTNSDGSVVLGSQNISIIAARYGIFDRDTLLAKINATLEGIIATSTS